METRGRPKEQNIEDSPRKFEKHYIDDDGVTVIWKYDLDKVPNGPISVENTYPKNWKSSSDKLEDSNKKLPITQQSWVNPANGKLVGYGRAKQLGLIK